MLQVIQNIFLSEAFIFFVLFAMFALFSAYALLSLGELAGYGLGWLLALFFMTVYASVAGADSAGQAVMMDKIRLTLWQVLLPSGMGVILGVGTIYALRQRSLMRSQQALKVALITALGLIIIFFMFASGPVERRVIGILALAFGIGAIFTAVLYHPSSAMPRTPNIPSRLDQIREEMRRNR